MMGSDDDGYASPDTGRRRRAGARAPEDLIRSNWQYALGAIGACMLIVAFVGAVMYFVSRDRIDDHDFTATMYCLPSDKFFIGTQPMTVAETNETAVALLTRAGNHIALEVQVNTLRDLSEGKLLYYDLRALMDSRCLPPSASFAPCTSVTDCDAVDSTMEPLIDNFISQLPVQSKLSLLFDLYDPFEPPPAFFARLNVQGVQDSELFYGIWAHVPIGGEDTQLSSAIFTINYITDAGTDWKLPDYCTGGTCPHIDIL